MKITKELIKEMIEEEVSSLGKTNVSKSDANRDLKQRSMDSAGQQDIDNKERGIIHQIEKSLSKLAKIGNLKDPGIFTILKKVDLVIQKEIQKIEGKNPNEQQ
jgi:hypothetical protein